MKIETIQKALKRADKKEKEWRDRAKKVVDRYRDDRKDSDSKFNILWANTEVLKPALYSATPKPDVRRRWRSENPSAREAARVLERCLAFSMDPGDETDFDRFAEKEMLDYLLPGRTVCRVDYHPTMTVTEKRVQLDAEFDEDTLERIYTKDGEVVTDFEEDEAGPFIVDTMDEVVFEDAPVTHVPYKHFRVDPDATEWSQVKWVAFGDHFYTLAELKSEFGGKFHDAPLDFREDDKDDAESMAQVWEVWHKPSRTVYAVIKGYDKILRKKKDPLRLSNFFPCPMPLYAIPSNDTLVPVPEFCLYQDQADEVNIMTARIAKLAEALKANGIYAADEEETLSRLLTSDDLTLIPVKNWRSMSEKGGLRGVIEWVPIEQIGKVLSGLMAERANLIQQIFELTGISDIQRGSTDPRETARAQSLKAGMGTRRLLPRQKAVQRYFRDILRLKAEIIAEHFEFDSIRAMSGIQAPDEVLQVLREDTMRAFSIDIETDSTVAPDEANDKQGAAEFLSAMSQFLAFAGPAIQADPKAKGPLGKILLWMTRKFKIARDVEEEVEAYIAAPEEQQQGDPEAEAAQAKLQAEQQAMQAELQLKKAEVEAEIKRKDIEANEKIKRENAAADAKMRREEREFEAEQRRKDELNRAKAEAARRPTQATIQ